MKGRTSVDVEIESAFGSVLMGDGADGFSSDLLDFLTPPTRSLARRDHDSNRLCASQQAAGPKPLILYLSLYHLKLNLPNKCKNKKLPFN